MAHSSDFWPTLLRDLCREQSVSMRELSRRSGLNRTTVRNLSNGIGRIKIDKLERILDVFGYDLDAFPQSDREAG